MPERFNGQIVVPSSGPKDAVIAFIGESPDWYSVEQNQPFAGRGGAMLNKALAKAGLDRQQVRVMYTAPIRAPEDQYAKHSAATKEWGLAKLRHELSQLPNLRVVVPMGTAALNALLPGLPANINSWRGSVLRPDHWPLVDISIAPAVAFDLPKWPFTIVPTYMPEYVAKSFTDLWPFLEDVRTASRVLRGEWQAPPPKKWFINRYDLLPDFVDDIIANGHLVSVDSEMDPFFIVALATEDSVHAFAWDKRAEAATQKLFASPNVLKVAHNWNHDATFITRVLGLELVGPLYDTMGGAHILDPELEKSLSPAISTRFTSWPYHKWMDSRNPIVYCGMDAAVCLDAYWPQIEALSDEGLLEVANHDHKLLRHLLEMQWEGIPVDEAERAKAERELLEKLNVEETKLGEMVQPIIREKIHRFQKPHLFRVDRRCDCCGGGTTQRAHCATCAGLSEVPKRKPDYAPLCPDGVCTIAGEDREFKRTKVSELKELMPQCRTCGGTGKVEHWLPFNPESTSQLADVLYRGAGIRARKFKGKETVRVDRLQAMDNPPPLVTQVIATGQVRAEYETVARLHPDTDGKLHCVFDPWGTVSGRVAGKEGLIGVGTNPMNIPKDSRNMIVAPDGYGFMYPDMEQIEARAVAVLGDEQELQKIYLSGGDSHTKVMELIHSRTGFDMNDVKVGSKAGQGRELTKRGVYAFMYGIRPPHLAGELGIAEELAAEILMTLGRTFPGVARYKTAIVEEVRRTRMVRSKTSRIRIFRDQLYDKDGSVLYELQKKAWSFSPQDMAAWILAEGMFEIAAKAPWIKRHIHVHDALLMSYPLERQDEAVEIAQNALSRTKWGMRFPAGMSVGPNWKVTSEKDSWKAANGYASWVIQPKEKAA
jgi:uracil-DNA glycosylase family 4